MNILWILLGISIGTLLAKYAPIRSNDLNTYTQRFICTVGSILIGFLVGAYITGLLEYKFYGYISFYSLEASIIFTISTWLVYQIFYLICASLPKAN